MQLSEMWMDPKIIIQSEVSQKEKYKQCVIFFVCVIQRNGTDEPICKVELETQTQRTNIWTGGKGGGMGWEIATDICKLFCMKQMAGQGLLHSTEGGG